METGSLRITCALENGEAICTNKERDISTDMGLGEAFNLPVEPKFAAETDHKPIVPLLSSKRLDDLPLRILRFQLQLARYDFSKHHVPGKLL